jgi:hypothetical protein
MNSEGKYYGGKAVKTKKLDASALSKIRNVDSPEDRKNKLRFTAKSDKGAYVKSGAGRKGGETVPATLPPGRMPRDVHVHVRVLDYD